LRENDESEKLVIKASCGVEHNMIVGSKDIFVEEEYLLEETPLEEPWVEECIKVTPSYMELTDATPIKFPLKNIPTSSLLPPYTPSSHFLEIPQYPPSQVLN